MHFHFSLEETDELLLCLGGVEVGYRANAESFLLLASLHISFLVYALEWWFFPISLYL